MLLLTEFIYRASIIQWRSLQRIHLDRVATSRLSPEEKKEKMDEWWNKAHELLIEEGVTEESIVNAVEHSHVCMREGSTELLSLCMKNKVWDDLHPCSSF